MAAPDIQERPTTVALGNDVDIWALGMRSRGDLDDGLTLRGFLGADEDADDPLDVDLEVDLVAVGGGSGNYVGQIAGAVAEPILAPLLWDEVAVIVESVPPGSYRDAFTVTVVPNQGSQ